MSIRSDSQHIIATIQAARREIAAYYMNPAPHNAEATLRLIAGLLEDGEFSKAMERIELRNKFKLVLP